MSLPLFFQEPKPQVWAFLLWKSAQAKVSGKTRFQTLIANVFFSSSFKKMGFV